MRKLTLYIAAVLLACVSNARADEEKLPEPLSAYSKLCKIAADASDLENARLYCTKANELMPLAENYLNLGSALVHAGFYNAAYDNFHKALLYKPGLAAAYFNMGRIFEAFGQKDAAKAKYTKAAELDDKTALEAIAEIDGKQTVARVAPKVEDPR